MFCLFQSWEAYKEKELDSADDMLCQNQLFATKPNWIQFEVSISDIIRDDCNFICVPDCVVCKLTKNPFTNNNITHRTDLITTDFDKQTLNKKKFDWELIKIVSIMFQVLD